MDRRGAQGFTLVELIVAIAVIGILASVAIPAMVTFVTTNRAAALSNEVVGALTVARSEAVTRAQPVSVCALAVAGGSACRAGAGATDWTSGWMLFVDNGALGVVDGDDTIVKVFPALKSGNTLEGTRAALSFQPTGFLSGAAATLRLRQDKCHDSSQRDIELSVTGRPSVNHVAC